MAFPTETVYGLGVRADCARAIERIFAVKGRPGAKALIVHVLSAAAARPLCARWPRAAERLADAFWPGPLTLVLERGPALAAALPASGHTVALRAPDHPATRQLLALCDFPVAAPSANLSGNAPPCTAAQVMEELGGLIPLVLDGGPVAGTPSTIVDLTREPAVVLRQGAVPEADVRAALGR